MNLTKFRNKKRARGSQKKNTQNQNLSRDSVVRMTKSDVRNIMESSKIIKGMYKRKLKKFKAHLSSETMNQKRYSTKTQGN